MRVRTVQRHYGSVLAGKKLKVDVLVEGSEVVDISQLEVSSGSEGVDSQVGVSGIVSVNGSHNIRFSSSKRSGNVRAQVRRWYPTTDMVTIRKCSITTAR